MQNIGFVNASNASSALCLRRTRFRLGLGAHHSVCRGWYWSFRFLQVHIVATVSVLIENCTCKTFFLCVVQVCVLCIAFREVTFLITLSNGFNPGSGSTALRLLVMKWLPCALLFTFGPWNQNEEVFYSRHQMTVVFAHPMPHPSFLTRSISPCPLFTVTCKPGFIRLLIPFLKMDGCESGGRAPVRPRRAWCEELGQGGREGRASPFAQSLLTPSLETSSGTSLKHK